METGQSYKRLYGFFDLSDRKCQTLLPFIYYFCFTFIFFRLYMCSSLFSHPVWKSFICIYDWINMAQCTLYKSCCDEWEWRRELVQGTFVTSGSLLTTMRMLTDKRGLWGLIQVIPGCAFSPLICWSYKWDPGCVIRQDYLTRLCYRYEWSWMVVTSMFRWH